MRKIKNISTYRLDLVELQKGMTALLHRLFSDVELMEYLSEDVHKNEEDTIQWVEAHINNNHTGNEMTWLIEDKKCFAMGWIAAKEIDPDVYLLSFMENKAYWGNGYMQEAVNGVIEFLFIKCRAKRIVATCHPRNRRSERVMQGVGMHRVWLSKTCMDKKSGDIPYQHCYVMDRFAQEGKDE